MNGSGVNWLNREAIKIPEMERIIWLHGIVEYFVLSFF